MRTRKKRLEAKKRRIIVEMKFGPGGGRRAVGKPLTAAAAVLISAVALALAVPAAAAGPDVSTALYFAGGGIFTDAVLVLAIPAAMILAAYEYSVLQRTKKNISKGK